MKSIDGATEIEFLEVEGLGKVVPGLKVVHPNFGPGTVKAIFLLHQNRIATHALGIDFVSLGYQTIAPNYAKMSRDDA